MSARDGSWLALATAALAAGVAAVGSVGQRRDRLPGGLGDGLGRGDVDPAQLRMGIEVELQHTGDRRLAEQISLDHLAEYPDYYTRLARMQAQAQRGSRAGEPWDPMEDPFIAKYARPPKLAEVLFHAVTRGGKYEVEALSDGVETAGTYRPIGTRMFRIVERTSGAHSASAGGLTREDLIEALRRTLADASQYSRIHYEVRLDKLTTGIPAKGYR